MKKTINYVLTKSINMKNGIGVTFINYELAEEFIDTLREMVLIDYYIEQVYEIDNIGKDIECGVFFWNDKYSNRVTDGARLFENEPATYYNGINELIKASKQ